MLISGRLQMMKLSTRNVLDGVISDHMVICQSWNESWKFLIAVLFNIWVTLYRMSEKELFGAVWIEMSLVQDVWILVVCYRMSEDELLITRWVWRCMDTAIIYPSLSSPECFWWWLNTVCSEAKNICNIEDRTMLVIVRRQHGFCLTHDILMLLHFLFAHICCPIGDPAMPGRTITSIVLLHCQDQCRSSL